MRFLRKIFVSCVLLTMPAWSQTSLETVLKQMDTAAARFRSAEADLVSEQYTKVINETEAQKGKAYFRRQDHDLQMALDLAEPDKKYVLYANGKVQVYQPKIDQVTEYNAGKNRSDVESFLVLGFGGGGHDLLKSYDVKYTGSEMIENIQTSKLELVPKSQRVRNNFERILLWIDPARGISIQQQFFEPSGDYRLAKYLDIQLNQKVPDNAFKLKTTGKTKVVSPQG
jgi:outer membrane lipoprotein-sorting protein